MLPSGASIYIKGADHARRCGRPTNRAADPQNPASRGLFRATHAAPTSLADDLAEWAEDEGKGQSHDR